MASATDKDASCANDPNFAIICGFFEKFSDILQIKYPNFQQLQEWIGNTDEVPNGLRDLHIKLLRKTRKTVHESAWETALSKFCYTYSHQDAWEIERFGYKKSSLKVKLKILRELVEAQFERNATFRSKIMSLSADALRFQPIGRDRLGHSYWVTQDNDTNLRVYQEHLDEEIWQVVATSREEFVTLINRLKGNEVVLPSEIGAIDEDSSSNSCQAVLEKPPPPEERDDSQDDDTNNATIASKIPNIKIKLATHENGVIKNKIENVGSTKVADKPIKLGVKIVNREKAKYEEMEDEEDEEDDEDDEDDENEDHEDEDEYTEEDETQQIRKDAENERVNKKVKPLIISHSKMTKINLDKPKKRLFDEQDKKLPDEPAVQKKLRPTLLDTKREIKVSRYENLKGESDEEEDDYEEEEEEEQEEEEEADGESGSDIEEEDKDEIERKNLIKNVVSEPIEEEILIVKGEGMGKECEGGCFNQFSSEELLNNCYTENYYDGEVGEAIEEDIFFVYGEGSGAECMVGNTKEETEPKATFFFGQAGCLKLSPVKKSPTLGSSVIDSKNQSATIIKSDADNSSVINGDTSEKKELNVDKCHIELEKISKSPDGDTSNDIVEKLGNKFSAKNDNKKIKGDKASAEICVEKPDPGSLSQNRKRRLSGKPEVLSESEENLNFKEKLENVEFVAKRKKMRCKMVNTTVRKKIESKRRSTKEETSSSEEEKSFVQEIPKTTTIKKASQIEILNTNTIPKDLNIENANKSMQACDSDKKEEKNVPVKDHKVPEHNLDGIDKDEVDKTSAVSEKTLNVVDKCGESHKSLDHIENVDNSGLDESKGKLLEKHTNTISFSHSNLDNNKKEISEDPEIIIDNKNKNKISTVNSKVKKEIISETALTENNLQNNNQTSIESISSASVPEDKKLQLADVLDTKLPLKNKKKPEIDKLFESENKTEVNEKKLCDENIQTDTSKSDTTNPSASDETLKIKPIVDSSARSTRSGRRSCVEVSVNCVQKKRGRVKATNKLESQTTLKAKKNKEENDLDSKELTNEENAIIPKENVKIEVKLEEQIKGQSDNELKDETDDKEEALPTLHLEAVASTLAKKPRGGPRKKQEVDTKNIIDADSETPVRQSRRIAQLKIREEADRRKMEEIALKKMKDDLKKKKKAQQKEIIDDPTVSEPTQSEKEENSEEEEEVKKKIEKQKKKGQKKNGWSSGSEDPEEEEEVEEHYYESDPGSPLFKSDHEFSPESDVEDESQIVPMKRARTARKEGEETIIDTETDEACIKCGKKDHPEWILLCDNCDKGYHCSCLSPVLFYIPEGDWFCPPCQQEQLITALEIRLKRYDEIVIQRKQEELERIQTLKIQEERKQREIEEELIEREKEKETTRRQKPEGSRSRNRSFRMGNRKKSHRRNRQNRKRKGSMYVEDASDESNSDSEGSSNNSNGTASSYSSSKSSKSSSSNSGSVTDSDNEPIYKLRKRRQINVSYRLHEYDDLIKSALKEEDDVAGAGNLGRGKDISNIVDAESGEDEVVDKKSPTNNSGKDNEPQRSGKHLGTDSADSEIEKTVKRKPKISKRGMKKKSRKLNALDVSSEGDNDSDEDFKTSSLDEDDEEEESNTISSNSDSSLEMFRHRKKGKKKTRRAARRAARERRKVKKFVVEDSDESEIELSKLKKKRKVDSDYSESETNEEDEDVSEEIDSDALCEDSTESDSAWRPGKRKKQSTGLPAKKEPRPKPKVFVKQKKVKHIEENERSFKATGIIKKKNRILDDDDDDDEDNGSSDSGRRTRGKRFTYLEDYEDDSSDGGIKPGVKRPDTPPEEREKFIKKQEEIKRMLAEKNTEAAKAAATPTLTPIKGGAKGHIRTPEKLDSLSTVPLSVIRQAKALDVDYLQRKGEPVSDVDGETDFDDDDLPDDFNPEDMDDEAIARMMEDEDFASQQVKLVGDNIAKQKKLKDNESTPPKQQLQTNPVGLSSQQTQQQQSLLQEPMRKRLPMPTLHPPLLRNPSHNAKFSQQLMGDHQHHPQPHLPLLQNALTSPLGQPISRNIQQVQTASPTVQLPPAKPIEESNKPRGRRKKITPLRDPLEKQKAAEAVTAATATIPTTTDPALSSSPSKAKSTPQSLQPPQSKATSLSVAQPPQLYKPPNQINTQPSVITRMPHLPQRLPLPGSFSDQRSRFYSSPNQLIGHRPPLRQGSGLVLGPMPPHHNMRPSYAGGPPPLRPVGDPRHTPPLRHQQYRPPTDQYPPRPRLGGSLINQYRPTIYGNPQVYPQGHTALQTNQQSSSIRPGCPSDYSPAAQFGPGPGPYGYYPPPPPLSVQQQHSNNPPPTQSVQAVPSSVIVAAPSVSTNLRQPPPSNSTIKSTSSSAPTSVVMAVPTARLNNISEPRKKLMTLETFNSKLTSPIADTSLRSPYASNPPPGDNEDQAEDDSPPPSQSAISTESTSEFSGLVSYFSSQQDDFNT